jgi:hypothetical protein
MQDTGYLFFWDQPRSAGAIMRDISIIPARAGIIGTVKGGKQGLVTMGSHIGAVRIVDTLSGEPVPDICRASQGTRELRLDEERRRARPHRFGAFFGSPACQGT